MKNREVEVEETDYGRYACGSYRHSVSAGSHYSQEEGDTAAASAPLLTVLQLRL